MAATTVEAEPVVEAIWCSETPYARVDPASINVGNRSFDIVTYVYENEREGRTYPIDIYNQAEWSKIQLAYGYLLENVTSVVTDDAVRVQTLSVEHLAPNPVRSTATLRFSTSRSGSFAGEVVDYLGRRVLAFPLGFLAAGMHETSLNLGAVPAGTYLCRLADTATGEYSVQPFIVER